MDSENIVLILNKNNVVEDSGNGIYRYNFKNDVTFTSEDKVAITQINLYNSWFNINQQYYNNSQFKYKWFDASGNLTQTFSVTIPDGYYSSKTLNEFLHTKLYANNHYIINDETGNVVYHFELLVNATYYSEQINVFAMTNDMTGYSYPPGATWVVPSTATTPQIEILNNGFSTLIGFNPGLYPATPVSTNQSYLSQFSPTMEPVSNINVLCNLIHNDLSYPINLLTSFTSNNVNFGDLISVNQNFPLYLNVSAGSYNFIQIEFLDQDFKRIPIKDPQVNIMLSIIKTKNKK